MKHLMLDIETFGTKPGSVIRSIGAIVFDPETNTMGESFYINVNSESQQELGMTIDPVTVAWWENQSKEAQDALIENQYGIHTALTKFNEWFKSVDAKYVWANGANFDPVLMEHAYFATDIPVPWTFYNIRCVESAWFS